MRALIIDDEPRAISLLEGYLAQHTGISLVGTYRNGHKALEHIEREPVDLVFLDIEMPHVSGLALSRLLPPETSIVFTTAHAQYAVNSYDVEAVDYLLKPITKKRFDTAVERVIARRLTTDMPEKPRSILLWLKSGTERLPVQSIAIQYLEKDGNYMTYHLPDRRIVTRETIAEALANLPDGFLQIHKSFIVQICHVRQVRSNSLVVHSVELPIGATFRESLPL